MSIKRILAMTQRYFYTLRHTYDRLTDLFYWPLMDLLIWGLTGLYFAQLNSKSPFTITVILTGLIFWIITWRAQYEITLNLLTELWDMNLVNIFSSPLTIYEWIASVMLFGGIKSVISLTFSALIAFLLYHYDFFQFGWWVIPIAINLVLAGWTIGFIVSAVIIRFGMRIQTIAWSAPYIIAPLSALYYPLSILPIWAQKIAIFIPTSYIFEAMRQHIYTHIISIDKIIISFALNVVYLVLSICLFICMFNKSKKLGLGRLI
jgi:ABC-2 type transport system permease protein